VVKSSNWEPWNNVECMPIRKGQGHGAGGVGVIWGPFLLTNSWFTCTSTMMVSYASLVKGPLVLRVFLGSGKHLYISNHAQAVLPKFYLLVSRNLQRQQQGLCQDYIGNNQEWKKKLQLSHSFPMPVRGQWVILKLVLTPVFSVHFVQ
jgi:hypothetical protein